MGFKPDDHLIKVKGGQQYLEVRWRLVWLREEHPEASVEVELVHLDMDAKLAVARATVTLPSGTRASDIGSETERDFPAGWIEKASCVPLRSQILTRKGFKHYDEVTVGEDVLAYDLTRDVTVWTPLRAVNLFPSAPVVRLSNRQGFTVDCTADHSWPVLHATHSAGARSYRRSLRQAQDLRPGDRLVLCAPAPDGDSPLTEQEAAIIGWLFTDGTVKRKGSYVRGSIMQSKPAGVAALRGLLGGLAHETLGRATTRTFPTGQTYDCQPCYTFILPGPLTRLLFAKAQIAGKADLAALALRLSGPARRAMLDTMMQAEASQRGVFHQKAGPVLDAFQLLAFLEGRAVAAPREFAVGSTVCIRQRLKKRRHLCASQLSREERPFQPVWCPTTDYGTWVMRQDHQVVVTGNTKAVGRALAALGFGTQFALELDEGESVADSPTQERAAVAARQAQGATRQAPAPPRATAPAEPAGFTQAAAAALAEGAKQTRNQAPADEALLTGLRAEVVAMLEHDGAALDLLRAKGTLPPEMTAEQLRKAKDWLLERERRNVALSVRLSRTIAASMTPEALRDVQQAVQKAKDEKGVTQAEYVGLLREVEARRQALAAGPLTALASPAPRMAQGTAR